MEWFSHKLRISVVKLGLSHNVRNQRAVCVDCLCRPPQYITCIRSLCVFNGFLGETNTTLQLNAVSLTACPQRKPPESGDRVIKWTSVVVAFTFFHTFTFYHFFLHSRGCSVSEFSSITICCWSFILCLMSFNYL